MIKQYIEQTDWRVKENSNTTYSFSGLVLHIATTEMAKYMLKEVYPKRVAEAHRSGLIHIHDLGFISSYCMGWSLENLLINGIKLTKNIGNKAISAPPKHLSSAINQLINFLGIVQMENAGAQAFNSVDNYLSAFVKSDKLTYDQVKQEVQSMIYHLNYPSRWGAQSPFSNFTLDITCPEDKINYPAIIGGSPMDFTYGNCQNEMDMFNKAMLETLEQGDSTGKMFTFPIITYNITKDFNWDLPIVNDICRVVAKNGFPYFANFVNSGMNPQDIRSMCCRLSLDKRELIKRGGGLFGAGDQTGAIGVITINLPKIGYLSKTEKEYFDLLDDALEIGLECHTIKRNMLEENLKLGLYPYTRQYITDFKNHFSVFGIIGMYESLLNFLGKSLDTEKGHMFALKVLDYINNKLIDFQCRTPDVLYNLEASPGEGCSYRLAKEDLKRYPDIITSGTKSNPYYLNSVHLPVNYSDNIFEVLDIEDELQTKFSGGTVIHLYLGEEVKSHQSIKNLIRKVCNNYKLPYFSITPTFSICPEHKYISGEHFNCPTCGIESLVYSRVVGYYSAISDWNRGKKQEFKDRKYYKVNESEWE